MRILIAGSGSIGRRHVANLQALCPQVRFVVLRRDAYHDAWSDALGAEVVSDVGVAIATRPDFAVVATPSARHIDVLPALITAGLPFYAEKPVVTTREDIELLRVQIQREHFTAVTQAGCNLRFLPSLQAARELIRDGALGRLARASFEAGQWLPDWRPSQDYRKSYSARSAQGGGVIFDLVHELDAARWILGDFEKIRAVAGRYSGLELECEDSAAILLNRDAGPVVSVSLDYVSRRPVRRYHFVGTEGSLTWDLANRKLEHVVADGTRDIDCGESGFDVAGTYRAAMQEFLVSITTGAATSQDVMDGLATAELAIRVKEAAQQ